MPARIVFDHPHRHRVHAITRGLSSVAGSAALFVGLVASLVAIPGSLFVLGLVALLISGDPEAGPWPPEDPAIRWLLVAWAISTPVAFLGVRSGMRLIRGRRTTVLFLRRFGYDNASRAVTFAAATTLGSAWRLVTLDDAEIAPLGVDEAPRRVFETITGVSRLTARLAQFLSFRVFPTVVTLIWIPIALEVLLAGDAWRNILDDGTFDPYFESLDMVMRLDVPFGYFGVSLSGLFAILATIAAFSFVGLMATFVALLLALPFAGVIGFISSSAGAVREAERAKTVAVRDRSGVRYAVDSIARRGRSIFAPRLVVLRVANTVWQETVTALATVTSVSIIDVSEPTEHLAWELSELERLFGDRYVIIGESDRVTRWALAPSEEPLSGSVEARVREWLEDREIVAYTGDRAGMRRFSRALRGVLLSLDGTPEAPATPAAGGGAHARPSR